jgi:hypothetical protein
MFRSTLVFLALVLLTGSFAKEARTQTLSSASTSADHISMLGPHCPPFPCPDDSLQDQIRFLVGHWPRDFEIAVVEARGEPKCSNVAGRAQCALRVEPVELILGHRGTVTSGAGHTPTKWNGPYEISYSFPEQKNVTKDTRFKVHKGERLVAFLTPAIQQPRMPTLYLANRLDRENDLTVESVRNAVADTLYQALGSSGGKQTQ